MRITNQKVVIWFGGQHALALEFASPGCIGVRLVDMGKVTGCRGY